ncbi:hypothetical protein NPIL_177231 [Nephila pilipes]|uniref:Uncharacterized protein n=1 Tax=Nephila pilipes TaxID=299642 RepID=A0A8X6MSF1_NEPPI|nr:hypothetical protein NPIL_177231 [Nephila pilipes]
MIPKVVSRRIFHRPVRKWDLIREVFKRRWMKESENFLIQHKTESEEFYWSKRNVFDRLDFDGELRKTAVANQLPKQERNIVATGKRY